MASQVNNSSWHPAFMPNSANESKKLDTTTLPNQEVTKSSSSDASASTFDPKLEHSIPGLEKDSFGGKGSDPALTDLRNALSTSLASPGGVELAEDPLHNGIIGAETQEVKADFPTTGPSHENGHSSTMSFTRTVAGGVDFGEDDEVDSEWNIRFEESDPFKSMAQTNRTNSFPSVPPAHTSAINHDFPISHSQAEDIMHEVENEAKRDLFVDDGDDNDDFFGQQVQPVDDEEFIPQLQHQEGNIQSESAIDEDSQERYEEGVPLVQSSEFNTMPQTTGHTFSDLDENEDDFFAQVNKPDEDIESLAPSNLKRKSTMQVIDSLNFNPIEQRQDVIEEEIMEKAQLDKSTGGGIAVSASTVLSQVLGDPNGDIHGQSMGLGLDSGDGDLAERWKAALAEDEFLDDDDELLPDDEDTEKVNEKTLDPADLFGSDDEGFLEDTDDNESFPSQPQQNVSPLPSAVKSPNGTVTSSDNLSGSAFSNRSSSSNSRYLPQGTSTNAPQPGNLYSPSGPLLTDLATQTPSASPLIPQIQNFQPPQQARPEMPKAQSFADKAKGGYSSPYDLPMDVVKPRKRPSTQQLHKAPPAVQPLQAPPPRSSSMYSNKSNASVSSLSPPTSSHSQQGQIQTQPQLTKTIRKSQSGFFEELPISSKPRQQVRHSSSYVPQSPSIHTPLNSGPDHSLAAQVSQPGLSPYQHPVSQPNQLPSPTSGLVAPQPISPYDHVSAPNMTAPPVASRYSPAPPALTQTAPPPAVSRYSPAPPIQRQTPPANPYMSSAPQPALAHQPRTSSPLAQFERSQYSQPQGANHDPSAFERRKSSAHESSLRNTHVHLPPTREVDENEQSNGGETQQHSFQRPTAHTPPPSYNAERNTLSPPKRGTSNYLPHQPLASQQRTFAPPQRSQTQSPGTAFAGPRLELSTSDPYQRPASVELPTSPRSVGIQPVPIVQSRPRGFSQGLNYITPTDGREHDPLQRWRGAPVFAWGVGGSIITSSPKDVPRYGIGQTIPLIVRSPGEVKIRNIKEIDPLPDRLASFPGPLKGKSKKKDVVSWLTAGIQILEHDATYLRSLAALSHEDKRTEERILLWKILRAFIEHDGVLEGNPTVDKAVRDILSPDLDDVAPSAAPLYATGADLTGISQSNSGTQSEPVDPTAVDQLRKHLLRGEREKAVWVAVDKRLWAHAMLISHTVSKELYKQVAQEFVQKEVKNIGDNTESLAALYEIFAGNFEESIDELVPPSARAGFKMISTSSNSVSSKGALDGLDRWRETLGLVLSNRSTDDSQALNALGKLLSGYGRAEAAHICFLFARSHTLFGGIDDPLTNVVLIGADHLRQPHLFDKEMEPILLSEVFEYGLSLSPATTTATSSPHLAVYKLQHATILAEYGYRDKAIQYCEAIAGSVTAQTRRSPYHHSLLVQALDELNSRLKQSPKDGNSSWISKPSMDKVSGSVWARFNQFVAGDADDAASTGSGVGSGTESGPFARIAGGTPSISPSQSQVDLYGPYSNGSTGLSNSIPIPATKAGSRYAPGSSHNPPGLEHQGSYGSQPRSSFEGRSSSEYRRYEPQRQMSDYRPTSQQSQSYAPQMSSSYSSQPAFIPHSNQDSQFSQPGSPYQQTHTPVTDQPPSNIYESPQGLNNIDGHRQSAPYLPSESSSRVPSSGYEPASINHDLSTPTAYKPPSSQGYEPPTSSYEPPTTSGYEPPVSSGYEPPSYEPASFNNEPDSPIDTRPKKKSFMDDDDDDIPALNKESAPREKTKAEKDREADEAFRKAAEADAAKATQAAPAKKGWGLGGWFGGGKKEPDMNQPNKPIRAKLGEESSFYYDPELKRWINKKGGDTAPTPMSTPPPPKAGPPRTASGPPTAMGGSSGPPHAPGLPQRAVSEQAHSSPLAQSDGSMAPPDARGLAPPSMIRSASGSSAVGASQSPSAPPSRPGTSMSNASSIDDLLGPPIPRKGGKAAVKGKKKGRGYIDVMGEK